MRSFWRYIGTVLWGVLCSIVFLVIVAYSTVNLTPVGLRSSIPERIQWSASLIFLVLAVLSFFKSRPRWGTFFLTLTGSVYIFLYWYLHHPI